MCSVLQNLHYAYTMNSFSNIHHSSVHLYTYLASLYDDGESANSSPSKDGPEAEAGPKLMREAGTDVCAS